MNENPGETPNPLNSNLNEAPNDGMLDANPSEPMHEENKPNDLVASSFNEKIEPSASTVPETKESTAEETSETKEMSTEGVPETKEPSTIETTATGATSSVIVEPVTKVAVNSLDPTGRVMEKTTDPVVTAPEKKSKKGLIFMLLGCLFFLISIVAIVAAVMLSKPKPDAVTLAMQKIMKGEAPKNTAIDGDINILINNPFSPFKRVNINLDSDTMVGLMINTSSAVLNLTDQSNNDYSLTFKEVYAANGDLYFMVTGIKDLLEDQQFLRLINGGSNDLSTNELQTNCINDESGMTNCADALVVDCADFAETDCIQTQSNPSSSMIGLMLPESAISKIEEYDDVWLRVSFDELDTMGLDYLGGNSSISCVTDLVSDVNKNSNSAIEIYSKYPFINSTSENVIISPKQNPIYEVRLDAKNFVGYLNAIQNTDLSKSLNKCMGWKNNVSVTEEDVNNVISQMPRTYVEVDHENNFTRLYMESEIGNSADDCDCPSDADCTVKCPSTNNSLSVTIDLGFSYPDNINVYEPVKYTDFKDVIQTIFTSMFENIQDNTQEQPEVTN